MHTIWQLTQVQLAGIVSLTAVIVEGSGQLPSKGHVRRIVRSYMIKPAQGLNIQLRSGDMVQDGVTDDHGSVTFKLKAETGKVIELWTEPYELPLNCVQQYPISFNLDNYSRYVVSDIDDTILYSYSPYTFKRIRTALFVKPDKRRPILTTHGLLKNYEDQGAAVIYLSKSESNLMPQITRFITKNQLPQGLLLLTPFLRSIQLFSPKKDPSHKIDRLRFLLDRTSGKFVLIGDDGQKDIKIYSQICLEYGDRIEKVYIYKTGPDLSSGKKRQWELLVQTGVKAVYLDHSSVN